MGDTALGITAVDSFKTGAIQLAPGDKLMLFTDGITEANAPNGEMFANKRLEAIISENHSKDTTSLCETIAEKVISFQAGHLFDDITLLVLQRII
jgi:sigma-B regulation protein RsbU (phosphoserine phosphatase)